MRGDVHAPFGGAGQVTSRLKSRHRASVRPSLPRGGWGNPSASLRPGIRIAGHKAMGLHIGTSAKTASSVKAARPAVHYGGPIGRAALR